MEAGVDDPELAETMAKHLIGSKSQNTVKKYYGSFRKWKEFCKSEGFNYAPAQAIHVAVYITKLLESSASYSTIAAAVYAISWIHKINGFQDPTQNGFVTNLLDSAKRHKSSNVVKKDAVDSDVIIKLCDLHGSSGDLLVLRDLSMISLAFSGFFQI